MKLILATLILTLSIPNIHAQPYKYLALKGGGIRGIAYTGALKVLEEKNITEGIEKVAGTSVGAIVGSLFSMGYSAKELEDIMFNLDIGTFNDGSWFFLGGQRRMRKNYGWYKGKRLEAWIGKQIKASTGNENTTFKDLHLLAKKDKKYRDLYITATNLSTQRLEIFSWETFPNLPIKVAVRASVSVPLYYGAVFLDSAGNVVSKHNKTDNYNIYVDGGIMANYPINLFPDSNSQVSKYTLGLKLERPQQIDYRKTQKGIAPYRIHSLGNFFGAFYNICIEQLNKGISYEEEKKNTIYISNGNLSPRVRHISLEQKQLLYNNGYEAAKAFLNEHPKN